MAESEKNTQEKKLIDPIKAKAQIQVYKEIYNFDKETNEEGKEQLPYSTNDGALRILKNASEKDIKDINKYFNERSDG